MRCIVKCEESDYGVCAKLINETMLGQYISSFEAFLITVKDKILFVPVASSIALYEEITETNLSPDILISADKSPNYILMGLGKMLLSLFKIDIKDQEVKNLYCYFLNKKDLKLTISCVLKIDWEETLSLNNITTHSIEMKEKQIWDIYDALLAFNTCLSDTMSSKIIWKSKRFTILCSCYKVSLIVQSCQSQNNENIDNLKQVLSYNIGTYNSNLNELDQIREHFFLCVNTTKILLSPPHQYRILDINNLETINTEMSIFSKLFNDVRMFILSHYMKGERDKTTTSLALYQKCFISGARGTGKTTFLSNLKFLLEHRFQVIMGNIHVKNKDDYDEYERYSPELPDDFYDSNKNKIQSPKPISISFPKVFGILNGNSRSFKQNLIEDIFFEHCYMLSGKKVILLIDNLENFKDFDRSIANTEDIEFNKIKEDLIYICAGNESEKPPVDSDWIIFDIGLPNERERHELLTKFLTPFQIDLTSSDLWDIAKRCPSYNPINLLNLCRRAILLAIEKKNIFENDYNKGILVTKECLEEAKKIVKPTTIQEFYVEVPHVNWDHIGGYDQTKQIIKEAVEWPIKYHQYYKQLNMKTSKGILLYGPPGCSKTLMAKAVATESLMNFISVKGPEIFSKWVGESESNIRNIFNRARANAPCVIFFDEIDSIATERGTNSHDVVGKRVLCQLLNEMDGIQESKGIVIIGATNRPHCLDSALVRPGRLDKLIYIPLPDFKARKEIFRTHLKNRIFDSRNELSNQSIEDNIEHLASCSVDFSGAEIACACEEASMIAFRKFIENLQKNDSYAYYAFDWDDLYNILKRMKPRTNSKDIDNYKRFSMSIEKF